MTPESSFENDPASSPPPLPGGESKSPDRSHNRSLIISALVILAAVVVTMYKVYSVQGESGPPDLTPVLMQSKYMVGVDALIEGNPIFAAQGYDSETLVNQLVGQTDSSPGTDRALAALSAYLVPDKPELLDRFSPTPSELTGEEADYHKQFIESLTNGGATEEVWADIEEKSGWFGRLAHVATLEKTNPQRQQFAKSCIPLAIGYFGFIGVAGIAVICGLILLILALSFYLNKSLKMRLVRPGNSRHVYIEAFAVFIGGYTLSSIIGGSVFGSKAGVAVSFALLAGSYILAMLWPRIRGVHFSQSRRETGLHMGRGLFREIFAGFIGYIAMLPLMLMAVLFVFFLVNNTDLPTPTHPIGSEFADGGPGKWFFLFFMAVVFAPLFEEILFRGFLFSGLRGCWPWISSALVTAFVFAAIHPQGILGIPVLMAIAVGFALIREWRDSVIACITAHAINNGSVMLLVMLMFRS